MLQQRDVVATQGHHHASRTGGALMDMTSGNAHGVGVIVKHKGLVLDVLGDDARRHPLHPG